MSRRIVVDITLDDTVMRHEGWDVDDVMAEVRGLLEEAGPAIDTISMDYEED